MWWGAPGQILPMSQSLRPDDLDHATRVGTSAGGEHPRHLGDAGWERPKEGELHFHWSPRWSSRLGRMERFAQDLVTASTDRVCSGQSTLIAYLRRW